MVKKCLLFLLTFWCLTAAPVSVAELTTGSRTPGSGDYVPGEILVKFDPEARQAALQRYRSRWNVRSRNRFSAIGVDHLRLPTGVTVADALELFWADPEVIYAEPNHYRYDALVPDDPQFGRLWGLHNSGQTVNDTAGIEDADVDAPEAWEVTTGSDGVLVAVIDSGLDFSHPDLAANLWINTGEVPDNGLDDDGNGYADDVRGWDFYLDDNAPASNDARGHGTHVAGTIAAAGNNGLGVAGLSWHAKIMALRFLDAYGSGDTAAAIRAFEYADAMGADIINCSWGGAGYSQALKDAIEASSALVVCAAGNSGSDADAAPHYPASYDSPNIIAVAATDANDSLAVFSNFGSVSVDVAAPGVNIYSCAPGRRTLWADDFEDGNIGDWKSGGPNNDWGLTGSESVSAPWSLTDSPGENYSQRTNSWIRTPVLDLSGARNARFGFKIKGRSEPGYDRLSLEVSTDGSVWVGAAVRVAGVGTLAGVSGTIAEWTEAYADLSPYDGLAAIYVRFAFLTDWTNNYDGWYIDDVAVTAASASYDGTEYRLLDGTSMAAPHVSGVAALIRAVNLLLPVADIKSIIANTVDAKPSLNGILTSGGRLNAFGAVASLTGGGTLQFGTAAYAVDENADSVTITITRTGGSDGAVSVSYDVVGGSATEYVDYTETGGTLLWADGESGFKSFMVSIINDTGYEGSETVEIALDSPAGGAVLGSPSAVVLSIIDDDYRPGRLQFETGAFTIGENQGPAQVTVTRADGTDGAVSVDYATTGGTAQAGSDYIYVSGSLNWADGDDTPKIFELPIIDDTVLEENETIGLSLSNPQGGASLGTADSAVLTIVENDLQMPGTVEFSAPAYSVGETGLTATITVMRTDGSDGTVSVNYAATDGTALAGEDYDSVNGMLSWPDGESNAKTFAVPIHDDGFYETDETVNLTLAAPTGGLKLGEQSTAVLTIMDDDAQPVNRAPSAIDDTAVIPEDNPLTVDVLSNDTDLDGDALTIVSVSQGGHGAVANNSGANVTYTPDPNFFGIDTFSYTISDGHETDTAAVTITVSAVNDAPLADDQAVKTDEDAAVAVTLTGSDNDGDDLAYAVVTGPAHGTLGGTAPNLTYTPNANFAGLDSFSYHTNDGQVDSSVALITITVNPVNDPPTANNDSYTTAEETTLVIPFPGVLANDSDVENDSLSAVLDAAPTNGTLDLDQNGSFVYTPDADFSGSDSFAYHSSDGMADSGIATVSITVSPANDAPVLEPVGPHSTAEGEMVAITLEAFDPDGDDLTFSAADLPPGAQFAPAAQTFSWVPYFGSSGNYRVLFRVIDNQTPPLGAHECVTVTVGNVNRPPVLAPIGPRDVAEGDVLSFEISAVDPEGDYLSLDAEDMPAGANFDNLSRTFTWPTQIGDAGNYPVSFSVTDDGDPAESDTEQVTITVGDVNRPPVIDPVGNRSIVEGDMLVITLTATDPDNDVLFYQCDVMPDGAVFDQDSQVFSWSTIIGDAGTYPLTFTVTDGGTPPESDAVSAVITVLRDPATNQAPEADAGPDQAVEEGEAVTLNGSNSLDPDTGDTLVYLWEQIEGDPVDLTGSRNAVASFTAPDIDSDGQPLVFRLTATDPLKLWDEDTCIVNVIRANLPPEADAGNDQVVRENRNAPIILDGSRSSDPDTTDTLTYFWEQIGGEAVVLTGKDQVTASFVAPDVGVGGQAFEFRLTVTNSGNLKAEDTCIVNVIWVNEPPTAHAGENQTADEGTTVILDGSGSFDPDDGIAAWRWKQTDTSGYPVTLSDPTAEKTTFVAPAVDAETVLRFELAVADTCGLVGTSGPVTVTVFDNGITDFGTGIACTTFPCGRPVGLECGQGAYLTLLNIYNTYEDYITSEGRFTLDTRYGVIEMEFRLDTPGTAATVTLYLTDPLPAEISWHQYDPDSGWLAIAASLSQSIASGTVLNADRTVMTLTITDNGQYDQDPNPGVLRTVGGLANSSAASNKDTSDSGGGGGGGGGCFIDMITSR